MIVIIKHIDIEGPGTFKEYLVSAGFAFRIVNLAKNEALPSLDECKAIVSLGGPMNVYETDKYPFLTKEESFLKEALAERKPILGICLGAQILAKITGAAVEKTTTKEIGWCDVELTQEASSDPLFEGLGQRFSVFQWHEDTFGIPIGGRLLAEGAKCRNQAFRFGDCAWGLQFHPEITKDMIVEWLDYYQNDLDRDKLLNDYSKIEDKYKQQAKTLYDNFCKVIAKQ